MGAAYQLTLGRHSYKFTDLKDVLAKASTHRSGDVLAGLAATSAEERVAAKYILSDLPLQIFLDEPLVPYEQDEVTRLIVDRHEAEAFAPVANLSIGEFRNWLLSDEADTGRLKPSLPG